MSAGKPESQDECSDRRDVRVRRRQTGPSTAARFRTAEQSAIIAEVEWVEIAYRLIERLEEEVVCRVENACQLSPSVVQSHHGLGRERGQGEANPDRKKRLTALVCVGLTRVGVEECLQFRDAGDRPAESGVLGCHRRSRPARLCVQSSLRKLC